MHRVEEVLVFYGPWKRRGEGNILLVFVSLKQVKSRTSGQWPRIQHSDSHDLCHKFTIILLISMDIWDRQVLIQVLPIIYTKWFSQFNTKTLQITYLLFLGINVKTGNWGYVVRILGGELDMIYAYIRFYDFMWYVNEILQLSSVHKL